MSRGNKTTLNKLNRIQRQATLQITGAMRTASGTVIEAYANLPPIRLQVLKACQRSSLRMATLPKAHLLYGAVRRCHKLFTRRHKSPLHHIMSCLHLEPNEIEEIGPVRRDPRWISKVGTIIEENKEAAKRRQSEEEADVRVYTDGSGIEGGIGAAAVLLRGNRPPKHLKYHLGSSEHHIVFGGECVGLLLGLELIRKEKNVTKALIAIDSQATVRAISSNKPGPGHHVLDQIHKGVEKMIADKPRLQIQAIWIPAHQGIRGNELADKYVKEAAKGESTQPPIKALRGTLPKSKSAIKETMQKQWKKTMYDTFRESPGGRRHSARYDPTLPSDKFCKDTSKLPRRNTSILTQLRTRHIPLRQHLFKIGKADTPACPKCGRRETIEHFLIECPAYNRERRQHLTGRLRRAAESTQKMLSDSKAWPALFAYINSTKRLEETFGQLEEQNNAE